MKRKPQQREFPVTGLVFNLAGERGDDPFRLEREKWEREERERQAQAYQAKMQRTLAECPGFAGCDAPASEQAVGKVVIEPALVQEARVWLKKRFRINEALELSDTGLCFEVAARPSRKRASSPGKTRVGDPFGKGEQFLLPLS